MEPIRNPLEDRFRYAGLEMELATTFSLPLGKSRLLNFRGHVGPE